MLDATAEHQSTVLLVVVGEKTNPSLASSMIRRHSTHKATQRLTLVCINILSNALQDREYSHPSFEVWLNPLESFSDLALALDPLFFQQRSSPRSSRQPSNAARSLNRLGYFLCGVILTVLVQCFVPSLRGSEGGQYHNHETATRPSFPRDSLDKLEFSYPPLHPKQDSIRLTTIRSGDWKDPIECLVETSLMRANRKYTALSYHWDAKPGIRQIRLNGADFNVTANLYDALQHIRNPYRSLAIWADAINLNQTDKEEKSHQIKLMTSIYKRAKKVLVWLGTCDGVDRETYHASLDFLKGDTNKWRQARGFVKSLLYIEYWKRAWIVQEISVAGGDDLRVQCGSYSLSWDQLTNLTKRYGQDYPRDRRVQYVLALADVRDSKYNGRHNYALSELLNKFHHVHCKHFQDKVYAFLGMANSDGGERLVANYSKETPRQVYEYVMNFQGRTPSEGRPKIGRWESFSNYVKGLAEWIQALPAASLWNFQEQKKVTMVQFSGMLRRLLSRKAGERLVDRNTCAPNPFISPSVRPKSILYWPKCGSENVSQWDINSLPSTRNFTVRASRVSKIKCFGPPVSRLLASAKLWQNWEDSITWNFDSDTEAYRNTSKMLELLHDTLKNSKKLERAHAEAFAADGKPLVHHIEDSQAEQPLHNFNNAEDAPDQDLSGPVVFAAEDFGYFGIAPRYAEVGDELYGFWNASSMALIRRRSSSELVGRAAMLSPQKHGDWFIPCGGLQAFLDQKSSTLDLKVSLQALTKLSLDTVMLPYTD